MKSCGKSGFPSFSVTRTKTRYFPSGDQRGDESRIPFVNWCVSPVVGETVQMEVLYPSFFSFTVILTNATREPSGDICGSLTQTKPNKSFSVMLRFCARAGMAQTTMVIRRKVRRRRMRFPFGIEFLVSHCNKAEHPQITQISQNQEQRRQSGAGWDEKRVKDPFFLLLPAAPA